MSKRNWKMLFEDMLLSISRIREYTGALSPGDFYNNQMVVDAVVRNIEIIGEASKNVPDDVREKYPDLPWKQMSGIRNRIVHAYFGVDKAIIWYIVENELSRLEELLKKALSDQ